jgi:radical SAM protein with 4Fe4S-binding SPASM domain
MEMFHMTHENYRKWWDEASTRQILPPTGFPLHLDIEVSGICNLKCRDCFQNLVKGHLGLMTFDTYKKIIDECEQKGLCAVKLQSRGEPFVHRQIYDFISYAKGKFFDLMITTNGTLFKDYSHLDRLISSGLTYIVFSVDPQHDEAIALNEPRGLSRDEAISYVLSNKGTDLFVRINCFVKEKQQIEKKSKALRCLFPSADLIHVGLLVDFNYDKDSVPSQKVVGNQPCEYLWQRMAIYWDGEVTACCRDFNNVFSFGNINRRTLEEIWNGDKLNRLRKIHLKDRDSVTLCKYCDTSRNCISLVKA